MAAAEMINEWPVCQKSLMAECLKILSKSLTGKLLSINLALFATIKNMITTQRIIKYKKTIPPINF
jgi:hypothetical protein